MEENIDMPIEQDVTIELILSVFKNYSDSKRMKEIKDIIVSLIHPDELIVDSEERSRIENKVVELISIDKRRGDESELKYSNGKYSKRKKRSDPKPIVDLLPSVEYTGTAGECAVISELLFSGYNANRKRTLTPRIFWDYPWPAFRNYTYLVHQRSKIHTWILTIRT